MAQRRRADILVRAHVRPNGVLQSACEADIRAGEHDRLSVVSGLVSNHVSEPVGEQRDNTFALVLGQVEQVIA